MYKFMCLVLLANGAFCADSRNLWQYLQAQPNYSDLVGLIKTAKLESALEAPGSLTVFAPDNAALATVPAATLASFKNDPSKLASLLTYHIVNQTLISPLISDGAKATTLNGQQITFHVKGGKVYANNVEITATDTIVSNGVIHGIGGLLVPVTENIVQYLIKHDNQFNDLFAAIVVAHLEGILEGGSFTLFAPTDDAFAKVKNSLTTEQKALSDLLEKHVVPGVYTSAQLKDGMTLHTVNGKDVTVHVGQNVKYGAATVTQPDIVVTNGVIHVIDTVITS